MGLQPGDGKVKLGKHLYRVGDGKVGELRDSTALRNDPEALRRRFAEDGYVFLRGVLPADVVEKGQHVVLQHLDSQDLIDRAFPLEEAVVAGGHCGDQGRVKGTEDLIQTDAFKAVVEHKALFDLFTDFFGTAVQTFDFKWLRAVMPGESSGFHMDSVYMYRGSPRLITCWVPLCDVSQKLGGLAVLRGSHEAKGFERIRDTYGAMDLDKDDVGGTGWFSEDPEEILHFGGQFDSAHFRLGDVVFFGMKTIHGSAVNRTNRWRLSCDVRFQPQDDPIDPRWVRSVDNKIEGLESRWSLHRHDRSMFPKTIDEAKKEWGVHWKESPSCQPESKRQRV